VGLPTGGADRHEARIAPDAGRVGADQRSQARTDLR